jgi:hypothetical protein
MTIANETHAATEVDVDTDVIIFKTRLWMMGSLMVAYSVAPGALIQFNAPRLGFMTAFLACVGFTYTVVRNVPLAFFGAGIIAPICWYVALIGLVGT